MARVSVLLPHRLGLLTYAAPAGAIAPGAIVEVPLGSRRLLGVVWDDPPDEAIAADRLREVRLASPLALTAELRRFVDFCAHYTMTARGAVLRLVLRDGEGLRAPAPRTALALSGTEPARWTEARTAVRDALAHGPLARRLLSERSGASAAVISSMLKAGLLQDVAVETPRACPVPAALSPAQIEAAERLPSGGFGVTLLEGVTGSGKTEVYMEAVARTLAGGRQALVLLPEIALTPALAARVERRFGRPPHEWHSQRTARERAALWHAAASGAADVVIGARSALFLPFARLGLIVVDEEHDASFKQEDGMLYHARDMAIARARAAEVPVVLASATPSIETRVNVERGRYGHVHLPARHSGTALPAIAAVDLRAEPPARGEWLAPPVRRAVSATLAAGEQALLFLNRRGYAPLTVCRRCGHRMHCPNCAASLVDHRLRKRLMCHHCGHEAHRPSACPACGGSDTLAPCGPGVERVAEEAAAVWPDARIEVLSSDLSGGAEAVRAALERVEAGACDLVVGTQLVAKGFNFPRLQLVVVVDADLGLENGDPRAAERTFQLLTQVTGRAGRVTDGGRALLQTHAPDHPVIAAMVGGQAEAFYEAEIEGRRAGGLPPFQRLASVIVSAPRREDALGHARALAASAPDGPIEVLGPAEAPLAVLRGRHRFRLLVRAARAVPLQSILGPWLDALPPQDAVRRAVDIDPQSFL